MTPSTLTSAPCWTTLLELDAATTLDMNWTVNKLRLPLSSFCRFEVMRETYVSRSSNLIQLLAAALGHNNSRRSLSLSQLDHLTSASQLQLDRIFWTRYFTGTPTPSHCGFLSITISPDSCLTRLAPLKLDLSTRLSWPAFWISNLL